MAKPLTVLCVGDVFGDPGRRAVQSLLPKLRKQYEVDLAVVNVENAAAGFGVTPEIARAFLGEGVDVMTSGNHIWDRKEIIEYIVRDNLLLRPANYPAGTPGAGSIVVKAGPHKVGVLNIMGRVFFPQLLDCPFRKADEEVERLRQETPIIVVDAHCEATSESQALGWYLDGRVSAVVGTHRHVQTADERLLPQGTHDWARFIRPAELAAWARRADLDASGLIGMTYNPLTKRYRLEPDTSVNYLAAFRRAGAGA